MPRYTLFANATATTIGGFRSSMRANREPFGEPRLEAQQITAMSPEINTGRVSR